MTCLSLEEVGREFHLQTSKWENCRLVPFILNKPILDKVRLFLDEANLLSACILTCLLAGHISNGIVVHRLFIYSLLVRIIWRVTLCHGVCGPSGHYTSCIGSLRNWCYESQNRTSVMETCIVDWYSNTMSLVPRNLYFSTNSPDYISKVRTKGGENLM
jgi:hypothetical protein